jgi:large subunit ribosomal protein L15
MNLNDVNRGVHKNKSRKRLGRGLGSGHGKTAGRGGKGQSARAGYWSPVTFEGGQMPLVRRTPKRGFNNRWAPTVAVVNVGDLDKHYKAGEEVNAENLAARNLAKGRYDVLKVLGNGELTKALKIAAHQFSASAKDKIEKAGGQLVVLPGKAPVVKNAKKKGAAVQAGASQ